MKFDGFLIRPKFFLNTLLKSAFDFIGKNAIGQLIYISNGKDSKAKHIFLQARGEQVLYY